MPRSAPARRRLARFVFLLPLGAAALPFAAAGCDGRPEGVIEDDDFDPAEQERINAEQEAFMNQQR